MKKILITRAAVARHYKKIATDTGGSLFNGSGRARNIYQWARGRAIAEELERQFDVTIEVTEDPEPVRGNAMASGDDHFDKLVEDGIIGKLDSGDVWAWASVKVSVEFDCACCGTTFQGDDYLGCCSYKDEADFKRGGYYEDMIQRALEDAEYPYEIEYEKKP